VIKRQKLVELDSRTLRPLPGRSVPLVGFTGAAGISPDGTRVAVAGRRVVRVIDLGTMDLVRDLPKPRGYASLVSWPRPGSLLVVNEVEGQEKVETLVLDPRSGRILAKHRLVARESWPFGVQRAGSAAVFLLHPFEGIGPVRLVRLNARGRLQVAVLHRIRSGKEWIEVEPGFDAVHNIWPALAVDEEGNHAFVIGSEDIVAEVDLQTLDVSYHSLQQQASILERLRNWLEPTADAKASDWVQLGALWLGEHALAVFGIRSVPYVEDGSLDERDEPLGLRLVDTRDWTVRVVDEDARWVDRSGDLLLAHASLWDSAAQERRGIGLRAYTLGGEERFHVLDDRPIIGVQVLDGRALVEFDDAPGRAVVDLEAGKVLDEEARRIGHMVVRAG
jgi:hypothetical protein